MVPLPDLVCQVEKSGMRASCLSAYDQSLRDVQKLHHMPSFAVKLPRLDIPPVPGNSGRSPGPGIDGILGVDSMGGVEGMSGISGTSGSAGSSCGSGISGISGGVGLVGRFDGRLVGWPVRSSGVRLKVLMG
jgi:hypothetical protein